MAATKGYRAAFRCHDDEQNFVTVVHFLATTGGQDPSDLAVALKTGAFPTALAKTLWTGGHYDDVTVTQIMSHGDPSPPLQDTEAMTLAGAYTPSNNSLPRAVTGLCRLRSNVSGRGTHGWIYGFPIRDTGAITPATGVLGGAYWTQLQAMSTALNAVLTVSTLSDAYKLAVFSRARWARGETNFLFTVTATTAFNRYKLLRKRDLEPGI